MHLAIQPYARRTKCLCYLIKPFNRILYQINSGKHRCPFSDAVLRTINLGLKFACRRTHAVDCGSIITAYIENIVKNACHISLFYYFCITELKFYTWSTY